MYWLGCLLRNCPGGTNPVAELPGIADLPATWWGPPVRSRVHRGGPSGLLTEPDPLHHPGPVHPHTAYPLVTMRIAVTYS